MQADKEILENHSEQKKEIKIYENIIQFVWVTFQIVFGSYCFII